jgi:hypothetical protein
MAAGAQREKKEPILEEGSGLPPKCKPPPVGPKSAEASIISFYLKLLGSPYLVYFYSK